MKHLILANALILSAAVMAQPQTTPPPAAPATPRVAPAPRVRVAPRAVVPMPFGDISGSYLGVDIDEVTSDRVAALKLKEERGVEITNVDQDAPAGKAGLKEHDVITDFNGQRVEGREQFTRFIRETPAGRTVTLGIVRDGQPLQIKATLADRREAWAKADKYKTKDRVIRIPAPEIPDIDIEVPQFEFATTMTTSTGVSIDNLTPQLAQYFGVKSGQGVLVKNVEKGSAAEKAGMKAGDVIVKVDNEPIESRGDYRQAIRHRNGETVKVVVVRNKAEQTLTLTLPAPRKESSRRMRVPPGDVSFENDFDEDSDFDFDFNTEALDLTNAVRLVAPLRHMISTSVNDAVTRIAIEPPAVPRVY